MFDRLKKRIFNSIFLLCLVFAVAVSTISYIVIVSNLYDAQIAKSNSNCGSAAKMASTYISQAMRFVENTAARRSLSLALTGGEYDVSQDLNRLCNYAVKIDGATLYGYDGHMSYSAELGAPPTLEELKAQPDILAFLEGNERTHISVRASAVAGVYNRTHYNAASGVISCMAKIYAGAEPCGILVADILPETLFSQRMLYTSFDTDCRFVICAGDQLFTADADVKQIVSGADRGYYLVSRTLTEDSRLQMYVSKAGYDRQCLMIGAAMIAFLSVLLCLLAWAARSVSRKAVTPLERLNEQMNLTNLPEVGG